MLTVFDAIQFVRSAVVVLFVGVSLLMLASGLIRRTRLTHVRMSWGTGRLFGLPLAPTLFLAGVVALIGYVAITGEQLVAVGWISAGAYICGGLCWYVGALLVGSTIVTDWGISGRSGTRAFQIHWHEISDYVVTDHRKDTKYVFFTFDGVGQKHRLELHVPAGVKDRFHSIVEFRLDSRFDRSRQRSMGQRALEQ